MKKLDSVNTGPLSPQWLAGSMQVWSCIICLLLPIVGSGLVQTFTPTPDSDWYNSLNKPPWTPPGWVFPLVWISLYFLMGFASWLVYCQGGFEKQWLPLLIYAIQLALNFGWTPLFFGAHQLGFAFLEICFLWVAVLATIVAFAPVAWAALLLLPYILWVSVATSISAYVFYHNSPTGTQGWTTLSAQ